MSSFGSNTSPYDIQNKTESECIEFDKQSMSVEIRYENCIMQVCQGIVLLVQGTKKPNSKIQALARLQHNNGCPLLVPIQFKSEFQQIFTKSEKVAYILKSQLEYFTFSLRLYLNSFQTKNGFQPEDKQLIQRILTKIKNALIYVGQLKIKNKISLQLIKTTLKLKKNTIGWIRKNMEAQQSLAKQCDVNHQENSVIQVSQIVQKMQLMDQQQKQASIRKGGYFLIQKKIVDLIGYNGIQMKNQTLALKRIRSSRSKESRQRLKVQKQLNIVKKIKKNKYLLNYYYTPESIQSHFYMDYVQKNLKEFLYEGRIKIKQIFNFSKQIIQAVSILHQYGIVHRDLKLQNIMVDTDKKALKIIDFGQSSIIGEQFQSKHNLGCTIPFSPIQCLFDIVQGYNKPQIDLWSILIIIYELAFKNVPIYYNKNIQQEIMSGWRTEGDFDAVFNLRPKKGIRKMQQLLSFLTEQGLRISQSERLKLKTINQVIKGIETFHDQVLLMVKTQN